MITIVERQGQKISVGDLVCGQTFEFNGKHFIVVEYNGEDSTQACINLLTGKEEHFTNKMKAHVTNLVLTEESSQGL